MEERIVFRGRQGGFLLVVLPVYWVFRWTDLYPGGLRGH